MKTLQLVLLILLSVVAIAKNSDNTSTINKISSVVEIKEGDLICIVFMNVGECEKCYNQAMGLFQLLSDSIDNPKVKAVMTVNVKRNRDLQVVKKNYNWNKPAFAKSDEVVKEYGLDRLDYFLMIDHKGKELYRINIIYLEKNFNKELKKLIRISRDYLKMK